MDRANVQLVTGVPYGFITWEETEGCRRFIESCVDFESVVYYKSVVFDNAERTVFFMPTDLQI